MKLICATVELAFQMNRSRRDMDESLVQLEEQRRETQRVKVDGQQEMEQVSVLDWAVYAGITDVVVVVYVLWGWGWQCVWGGVALRCCGSLCCFGG